MNARGIFRAIFVYYQRFSNSTFSHLYTIFFVCRTLSPNSSESGSNQMWSRSLREITARSLSEWMCSAISSCI